VWRTVEVAINPVRLAPKVTWRLTATLPTRAELRNVLGYLEQSVLLDENAPHTPAVFEVDLSLGCLQSPIQGFLEALSGSSIAVSAARRTNTALQRPKRPYLSRIDERTTHGPLCDADPRRNRRLTGFVADIASACAANTDASRQFHPSHVCGQICTGRPFQLRPYPPLPSAHLRKHQWSHQLTFSCCLFGCEFHNGNGSQLWHPYFGHLTHR